MSEQSKTERAEWAGKRIRDVRCPQCGWFFELNWNDYGNLNVERPQTLFVRDCPSGGVYDVHVECPKCDYREDF